MMAANKFVKVAAAAAVGVVMIGLLFSPTAGESMTPFSTFNLICPRVNAGLF